MNSPPPFVMIATPCFGKMVHQDYMISVIQLMHARAGLGIDLDVSLLGGDALISRARSSLVAHFMSNKNATHLLFVDADISFQPSQVARLLEFDRDFVAALYPVKNIAWNNIAERVCAGEPLPLAGLSYVGKFCEGDDLKIESGFATAAYAGTGMQLIKRSVFERMFEAYPQLKYQRIDTAATVVAPQAHQYALFDCMIDTATGTYLSEDYSFCRRWRAIGGQIWLDLASELTHTGTINFVGNYAARFTTITKRQNSDQEPI